MIHLDTHVAVWLCAGLTERFPKTLLDELTSSALCISPMVALELSYLYEIGRIAIPGEAVVADLADRLGICLCSPRFDLVARIAQGYNWTRDPFDRMIAATASAEAAVLVSKDATILKHYALGKWG